MFGALRAISQQARLVAAGSRQNSFRRKPFDGDAVAAATCDE